ncbi:MAG: lysophospholipid acyltransferase family protein [Armatimonadota bacterium]
MYYSIFKVISKIVFFLNGGLKSVNAGNIPKTGGVILAPNHISYADPPAVGTAMNRKVHFMAKEELFKPLIMGAIIKAVGSFPVKRGTADRKAIKQAMDLLKAGEVICLFPEGTRSLDGNLQEPELGIGLIALKSGAPIVPVAVIGTDTVLPSDGSRPKRCRVIVEYGEPLTFEDLCETGDSRHNIEEVGIRTMASIGNLLAKYKNQ